MSAETKRWVDEDGIFHLEIPLFHPRWDVEKKEMTPMPSTKLGNLYSGFHLSVKLACDKWNREYTGQFPGFVFCFEAGN